MEDQNIFFSTTATYDPATGRTTIKMVDAYSLSYKEIFEKYGIGDDGMWLAHKKAMTTIESLIDWKCSFYIISQFYGEGNVRVYDPSKPLSPLFNELLERRYPFLKPRITYTPITPKIMEGWLQNLPQFLKKENQGEDPERSVARDDDR